MNKLQTFFLITLLITNFPVNALTNWQAHAKNLHKTGSQQVEISQRQAISIAQQHIKGRVLDIRRSEDIYRIKILSDQGSVHVVKVNAKDGKIKTGY